jgi:hypothetical protein
MADATSFNLMDGQKAERKLLVTAVNVGDSITAQSGTPEWQIVGCGVEDSSIEYNPDKETVTDILGITETTVKKFETAQEMTPMTVRGGSKLALKLYNQIKYNRLSEFSMYEVMQIHAYIGVGTGVQTAYEAEVHKNCTLTPKSLGGSSNVDMPIDINFSNDKVHGTVDHYKYGETVTFTPASASV